MKSSANGQTGGTLILLAGVGEMTVTAKSAEKGLSLETRGTQQGIGEVA